MVKIKEETSNRQLATSLTANQLNQQPANQ